MQRIPAAVAPLFTNLTQGLPTLLGVNFVGLYVYGSVLDEEFDPACSDVDCITVTERALDDDAFRRLSQWLSDAALEDHWFTRLQVLFLAGRNVLVEDPTACLYQFGDLKRSGSDGNPIIWLDFFQRGRTLIGPHPESFVPEITPEILHRALVREVGYLYEECVQKPDPEHRDVPAYRSYAVITLCRILYSHRTGEVTSKPRAAAWALEHAPTVWHDLIRSALAVGETGELRSLPLSRIGAFIDYVRAQLAATCGPQATM
ncbi:MAG TPA: aminoglycoside adenylyltransferase domain-containing protein [Gemmatimonadota bacterium]|nr:aminoglycoside adenylyltransferase domain-containing protein [Gemmatimonadota bacterium]